jgi:tetratricopeptide (TPR) repeat protein
MRHLSRKVTTLHAVLVLLLVSSCMPQKNPQIGKMPAQRTHIDFDRLRMKSEQFVVQGDYKNALDVYANLCRKYPDDQALSTNYGKTVEDINRAAGEAFSKEDFISSGRAYYVLLKNNSSCHGPVREQTIDKGFLLGRLEDCSSHLSQRALAEYRKGNLAEAISIWKNILAFDPNNTGVEKAIETATVQMKNLQ